MPGVLLVLPLELLSVKSVGKKTRDTVTLFFPLDFRGVPATVYNSAFIGGFFSNPLKSLVRFWY